MSRRRSAGNSPSGNTEIATTSIADRTDTPSASSYVGRYAPSPTGPLHFGSLAAALASYLQARRAQGTWILRIENIDPPREMPGAADQIMACLEAHGLEWDGPVLWQSDDRARHAKLLAGLRDAGLVYACRCSRKHLRRTARKGVLGPVYPGTCRSLGLADGPDRALRLRTGPGRIEFEDRVQGRVMYEVASDIGDFVLRRRDGLTAYALAVVADDAAQGITEIVRGCDLLPFTPAQIHLQQQAGLPTPRYVHIPTAVDASDRKLSKQTGARPVDSASAAANLIASLHFLGQEPPARLSNAPIADVLSWARANWSLDSVPRRAVRRAPAHTTNDSNKTC